MDYCGYGCYSSKDVSELRKHMRDAGFTCANNPRFGVKTVGGYTFYRSYYTIVGYIDPSGAFHRTWADFSRSTQNHLRKYAGMRFLQDEWFALPVESAPVGFEFGSHGYIYC